MADIKLRPYQQEDSDALINRRRCLYIAGMGAGKTITVIHALGRALSEGLVKKALILAPPRVISSAWQSDLKRFCPDSIQSTALSKADKGNVVLASIHMAHKISLSEYDALVIDEISMLKNPKSVKYKKLIKSIKQFNIIWGLTGTPHPQNYLDMYTQMQLCSGQECFPETSFYKWRERCSYTTDWQGYKWGMHTWYADEFLRRIAKYSIVLPKSREIRIPQKTFNCRISTPKEVEDMADAMLRDYVLEMEDFSFIDETEDFDMEELISLQADSKAIATLKASQLLAGLVYDDEGRVVHVSEYKINSLAKLLKKVNRPAIIVYQFKSELAALRRLLGSNMKELRDSNSTVEEWNSGRLKYLALHPASGGHGLNLQFGGHDLIWFSLTWSAEQYAQTCKRIARFGQSEVANVYRIIPRHPLIERQLKTIEQRLEVQEEFIQSIATRISDLE